MVSSRSSARRLQYRSKSKSFGPSPHGYSFLSVRYYSELTIQSRKGGEVGFWLIGCPYVLDLQTDFSERKECVGGHHGHGDAPPPQLAPQLAR